MGQQVREVYGASLSPDATAFAHIVDDGGYPRAVQRFLRGWRASSSRDVELPVEGPVSRVVHSADGQWLVNNAGQVRLGPFADFPESHLETLLATQLRGHFNVSRPAWRAMAAAGGGRFVNVSSGSAWGLPGGVGYSMVKMGVIGLTRSMAAEGMDAVAPAS